MNDSEKGKGRARLLVALLIVLSLALLAVAGIAAYGKYQINKIPAMTFAEALRYTTAGNPDAVITVGIVQDGESRYTVYGEDGAILPEALHTYEIGSLTKTFTAALVRRAIDEGKLELDASIDSYLPLDGPGPYPTVRQLLTHTSGCKAYYFEWPMFWNRLKGRNDFLGIGDSMVLEQAEKLSLSEQNYPFRYSNFGYAVLGLVLETVYQTEYTTLMNEYLADDLGLDGTRISDGSGDLGNYWDWEPGDTYLSAGGITSNVEDMLAYAEMQLADDTVFGECHESLAAIDASSESYKTMGIHMDEIGMAWIIDRENGIIWHNGGTGDYNCYLGFLPEKDLAVVILSNLPPDEKIPATVMGIKILKELTAPTASVIARSEATWQSAPLGTT